jgi:predicted transcriptional regulator
MSKMNIQSEKLQLIEWISRLEDSDIVNILRQVKENLSGETVKLSQEEQAGIDRGLKDIEEDRVHSHESVKKIYDKYL